MFRSLKNTCSFIAALFAGTFFVLLFNAPSFAQSPGDIRFAATTQIAVPGHLLEPGNYTFRRLNSDEPGIYEVLDSSGQLIGVEQVTPANRAQRGDTEIDIAAPDSDGVRLVQEWFGPGDTDGYQFVYSKKIVQKLDQLAAVQSRATGSIAGQP